MPSRQTSQAKKASTTATGNGNRAACLHVNRSCSICIRLTGGAQALRIDSTVDVLIWQMLRSGHGSESDPQIAPQRASHQSVFGSDNSQSAPRPSMKTLLVDDHELFREGMALLVARSFPQLQLLEANSLASAVRQVELHRDLQLAFLDLALPDSQASDTLRAFRMQAPHVSVIVVSADAAPASVLEAIDAGAAGYIPKTASSTVMEAALRLVLEGGVYLPQPLVCMPEQPWSTGLSPRQLEVLGLLVQGQSNKSMCRRLGISESTVKTHLEAIFRRLGVASRTQAVVAVAGLGMRLPSRQRNAAQ